MPAGSSVQLLDLERALHRHAEVARANAQIATDAFRDAAKGREFVRQLVALCRRLSADPRGIDRELLAAAEAWAGEGE